MDGFPRKHISLGGSGMFVYVDVTRYRLAIMTAVKMLRNE